MEIVIVPKEELRTLIADSLNACLQDLQPTPQKDDLPEWLTRQQVANYLACSLATVDTYSREGLLTKHYINGLPRFKRDEVREALNNL